ncbi:MAG: hypothetical protein JRG81_08965 [Deltaproteobacteria bacterium]|nr:hypothetical protein [Deltaproteobacteria bacterium]
MRSFLLKLLIMGVMLIGLPLTGVILARYPAARYLEFPPKTQFIVHASFSWIAFAAIALLILLSAAPFILKGFRKKPAKKALPHKPFPWWGWLSILLLIVSWTIAWTRMPISKAFQEYTFIPLWLFYILIVNAITYRRTGHCMMLDKPVHFLFLFPFSAAFWWFFEYLNRFVQNWYYVGVYYGTVKYFLLATISFSTVLPAVLGTRDLLMSTKRIKEGFHGIFFIKPENPGMVAMAILLLSAIGLGCVGIFPDYLFPLLWVSPLLIILSLQTLFKEKHILSDIAEGNWNVVVGAAFSALICGIFWEMWNYYSLAKWEYSVPLVHRFKIFEMPILGYAGYLPFGLECAVVGDILAKIFANRTGGPSPN